MKIRYQIQTEQGSRIIKNPPPETVKMWTDSGVRFEQLYGYENIKRDETSDNLVTKLVENKFNEFFGPLSLRIESYYEKLEKMDSLLDRERKRDLEESSKKLNRLKIIIFTIGILNFLALLTLRG